MRIILDEKALRCLMAQHNIKTYKQLCEECGLVYDTFNSQRSLYKTVSKEYFWLMSDFFNCHVEDLQTIDWTK